MNNSKKVLSVLFISLFTLNTYAGTSDNGGSFFGMGDSNNQRADNTLDNERRFLPKGQDLSDMSQSEIRHLQNMKKEQLVQELQLKTFNKMVKNKTDNRDVDYNQKLQYVYQRQLRDEDLTPEQKQKIYAGLRKAKAAEAEARKKYEKSKNASDLAYANMVKENEKAMLDEVTRLRENRNKQKNIDVQQFFDYTKSEKYQKNQKKINKQAQETIKTAQKKNEKPKPVFNYDTEPKGLTKAQKDKLKEFLNTPEGQALSPTVKESIDNLLKGKTLPDQKQKVRKENRVFFDFDGEEEEEEAVNLPSQISSLAEAEKLFDKDGKGGVLIPNQPIHMAPQVREAIRKRVELLVKTQGLYGIRTYERDALNAMLFNYGVQLLEDGTVISLEPVDDPEQSAQEAPEVAPGVAVPKGAQQVVIGEYSPTDEDEKLPNLDELNNTTASKGTTPSDAVEDYEYGYDTYQQSEKSDKRSSDVSAGQRAEETLKQQTLKEFNLDGVNK